MAKKDSDFGERLRAWPRSIHFGDMFSGAGTFRKVTDALLAALRKKFPMDMNGLEAGVDRTD
jgi:hypothetical protein